MYLQRPRKRAVAPSQLSQQAITMHGITPILGSLSAAFAPLARAGPDEIIPILILLGLAAFGVFCLAFWLWMLIHVLVKQSDSSEKLVWVIVMLFLPVIGSLIYFFVKFLPGTRSESTRQ
jgi:hypothetical protein